MRLTAPSSFSPVFLDSRAKRFTSPALDSHQQKRLPPPGFTLRLYDLILHYIIYMISHIISCHVILYHIILLRLHGNPPPTPTIDPDTTSRAWAWSSSTRMIVVLSSEKRLSPRTASTCGCGRRSSWPRRSSTRRPQTLQLRRRARGAPARQAEGAREPNRPLGRMTGRFQLQEPLALCPKRAVGQVLEALGPILAPQLFEARFQALL